MQSVLRTVHQPFGLTGILLSDAHPIACFYIPSTTVITCREQCVEGVARIAHPIAWPVEVGIVQITLQEPGTDGLPFGTEIDAVLVLHTAALTETACMQGGIALVVIAVEQHQRQGLGSSPV